MYSLHKTRKWRIKFKGKDFLLVGGAITTDYLYENFLPSYAHLYENGDVLRYGLKIGSQKDIEMIKDCDADTH